MGARSPIAIVMGVLLMLLILELLRRVLLSEKYAALWLLVSLVVLVLAVFPSILFWISSTLGFGVPSNLVFFAGGVVLLFVSLQLSLEVGRLEGETQRLAEEIALLRARADGTADHAPPPES
jgi:hypothetical protein